MSLNYNTQIRFPKLETSVNIDLQADIMRILICIIYLLFPVSSWACEKFAFDNKLPITKIHKVEILCKGQFAIGFDSSIKMARWVAYKMDPRMVADSNMPRAYSFKADPLIPKEMQLTNEDFYKTKIDKGHLVAFEDVNSDDASSRESFLFSNIVPQYDYYNRGIWKSLEFFARKQASQREVFIVTGPVLEGATKVGNMLVPSAFWKIIIDPSSKTIATYVIPHDKSVIKADFNDYLSSETVVFKLTKLNPVPSRKRLLEKRKGP